MPYLKYFWYVVRHKWFVLVAGLKTKAPLWQLLIHDWSKFLPDEFIPYATYFYNQKLQNRENIEAFGLFTNAELAPYGYYAKDRFNVAWLFHQRRNPHHWQYWMFPDSYELPGSDVVNGCLPMPPNYVMEMVADWMGASMAYTGDWNMSDWLAKNFHKVKLHPGSMYGLVVILNELGYEVKA